MYTTGFLFTLDILIWLLSLLRKVKIKLLLVVNN